MSHKEKIYFSPSDQGGIAPVISTFSDSSVYATGDGNEHRGKVGAARTLRKMKNHTRRTTRTRDKAELKKMFDDEKTLDTKVPSVL